MSQFNLENEINSAVRFDAPLMRGPLMRWQRKMNDSEQNSSVNSSTSTQTIKTPMKNPSQATSQPKTPGSSHSLNKTPKSTGKTRASGAKCCKTPNGGDRFIPHRNTTHFDLAHFKIMHDSQKSEDMEVMSPSQLEYQRVMSDNLNGDLLKNKIIVYKQKAPQAPEGFHNNLKVLYSTSKSTVSAQKTTRHIPQVPERILDAPEIMDDYYLNLLDWSENNHLAVVLGSSVYIWNAASGDITQLLETEDSADYVGAVAWVKEGNYLAVGTSIGEVQLWDVEQQKRLRNMTSHAARVSALSWNSYVLSSGSRSGSIHHHDVRIADHHVSTLTGHSQDVCGLKWSPDGKYLASGGNDNILNVWGTQYGQNAADNRPIHTFTQHQAAVKALAWCPWQASLLASGGGTADRHIRFWNCNTGSHLNSVDTKSQVCAVLWSKEYKELVSSHGFAQNQLIIWKYPTMSKVAELTGHTARVLHMAMSPDGTTVVSAGADETLRLWKCFAVDEQKQKVKSVTKSTTSSMSRHQLIR